MRFATPSIKIASPFFGANFRLRIKNSGPFFFQRFVRPSSASSNTRTIFTRSAMPRSKPSFYAVYNGREPGIYSSWDDCKQQVDGYSHAEHKKFSSEAEARAFLDHGYQTDSAPVAPEPSVYAVYNGRQPGIYNSWDDCKEQVDGYSNAQHKKFSSEAEATAFVDHGYAMSSAPVAPVTGTMPSARHISSSASTFVRNPPVSSEPSIRGSHVMNEDKWDVVYTDGACQGNGKEGASAGIGVWWGKNDPRNLSERCPGNQTNNRAELTAIIRALETAPQGGKPLVIKTDSSYSISCVQDWLPQWRQNGFKTADGHDVKNKEEITYLSKLIQSRGSNNVRLEFVRGHSGDTGNEEADRLARHGARQPERD